MFDIRWVFTYLSLINTTTAAVLISSCLSLHGPHHDYDANDNALAATSIVHPPSGNYDRCEVIYPDMYEKTLNFYKLMFAKDPATIHNSEAKKTAQRSRIMFENMILHPQHPLHPAAFLAVIKDFETSASLKYWSINNFHYNSSSKNCFFGDCYGYFQIDTAAENNWSLHGICGKDGLDFLGRIGGPDYCSAFWWWTTANSGLKCLMLKDVATYTGPVIRKQVCNFTTDINPCTTPNTPWTTSTFAYAYECSYRQKNQWKDHGIHDSWQKMYTGFFYDDRFQPTALGIEKGIKIPYQQIHGYEYCAVKHFAERHYRKGTHEWPKFSAASIPSELKLAAVHQFAHAVGITPQWTNYPWRALSDSEQTAILNYNREWERNNQDTNNSPYLDTNQATITLPSTSEENTVIVK